VSNQRLKVTEAALSNPEAKLRLALNAAQLGIWEWDIVQSEFDYDHRGREVFGFGPDEPITYEKLRARTHPDDYAMASEALQRALDPAIRAKQSYEYRVVMPDGQVKWILAHGDVTFAPVNGVDRPVRYIGTVQDVTARKRAEEALRISEAALRESESRLRLALRSARLAVWDYDLRSNRITPSVELNRMFGFADDDEPDAAAFRSRYLPGEAERMSTIGQAAVASGETFFQVEARIKWPDGSIHWLAMATETILDAQGRPVAAFGIVTDITHRKAEEEHRTLLVGELNHRVKNMLATVQAIAQQTFKGPADPAAAQDTFKARLATLANATSILVSENWHQARLEDVVSAALLPFQKDANIYCTYDGGAEEVRIGPQSTISLAMILHELCTNAVKYGALSVDGGRVDVTWTGARETGAQRLRMRWEERGGPPVRPQRHVGFGTKLIERGIAAELDATVALDFSPGGVICTIDARIPR
jgi:PAS domain S-box-containing protein